MVLPCTRKIKSTLGPPDRLLWFMAGAWLWTCAQALPLPKWLAQTLRLQSVQSAARLESVVDFAIPLTLSVDPGATQAQIVVGVAILCAFLAGRLMNPVTPEPWPARPPWP